MTYSATLHFHTTSEMYLRYTGCLFSSSLACKSTFGGNPVGLLQTIAIAVIGHRLLVLWQLKSMVGTTPWNNFSNLLIKSLALNIGDHKESVKIWLRLGSVCQPLEQQNKWFYPASALAGRTDSAWSLSSSETEILTHVPSLAQFPVLSVSAGAG